MTSPYHSQHHLCPSKTYEHSCNCLIYYARRSALYLLPKAYALCRDKY